MADVPVAAFFLKKKSCAVLRSFFGETYVEQKNRVMREVACTLVQNTDPVFVISNNTGDKEQFDALVHDVVQVIRWFGLQDEIVARAVRCDATPHDFLRIDSEDFTESVLVLVPEFQGAHWGPKGFHEPL